jgi:hypothetical protein
MPQQFNTFDLGRVLQTAEAIKGMRREAENDRMRNMYMGEQVETMQQNRGINASQEQRAQAEQQAKLKAIEAKRVYHVADAVYRSDHPAAAVANLAPDFVQEFEAQHGAGAFSRLQDDQVKQLFAGMRERSMIAAGIQPKYSNPEPGLQDGREVFFQTDEQGTPRVLPGIAPRPQKPGMSTSLELPDGTKVQIGDGGVPQYGGVGLTKPNQTKLQEAFINAQGNSYALREQLARYRPEFSTVGGRVKAGIADLKEQAGFENAPQQQQFLSDFTSWKADTARLLSQYLNQLSGAAISPHEEVRLKAGFPNADDGPTQYQAKAQSTMRTFALVQARAAYLLSNPAQSMDSVSLDQMSGIVTSEANRLAKALESGGMNAEQARQTAIQKTRARFGIDDAQ